MPPSPSWRCSPGREHKMDNPHKRGHSFESGLILRARDDDLALFNDMQNKERENFLLHTADDFDDSLSKLRHRPGFKLGITIPARGESSDLLNADGEKNDYDWLLTPPDTPLFPSLDDEEPQLQNPLPRGRPRSLPINISRSSSTNGNTCRNSRSSASPHRLSPSPRSSNNMGQLVPRPSPAPRSSPPPVARSGTPSRRQSTPNKPSTSTPRSSTPTLRGTSTGSSGQASSSGRRGASPVRASRGNSASPKLHGWQSNLPGFSFEAPPNLRTSISDRPSPHARGLSPTPRSGRGRHSMSPASRSATSSHSNDRELCSSYSKGSVVSSGDDDVDSLHSMAISSSPPARRNGMSANIRTMEFCKKPSKTSPSNSVPKRSFDSVIRQMGHRKTPQNMFRPLLSSVPSTTFYVGKANSTHRPMFSRNSSLTTSTSASSDQGASVAPDMESSEHDQNDLPGEWERIPDPDNHEEMFIFDKVDDILRDSGQKLHAGTTHSGTGSFDADRSNMIDAIECEESAFNLAGVECLGVTTDNTHAAGGLSAVNGCEIMAVCSKCGKKFSLLGVIGETEGCQECMEIDGLIATRESLLSSTRPQHQTPTEITVGRDATVDVVPLSIGVPELPESSYGEVILGPHENNTEKGLNCHDASYVQLVMDDSEPLLSDQQLDNPQYVSSTHSDCGSKFVQREPTAHPSLKVDNPEGTGICVLLQQRSINSKWSVVQSRAFSATSILCAEPSFVRDNTSALRRSIGRDSAFTSSSVGMESFRQMDDHILHQISSRKMEIDSVRIDTDVKSQCSGSHSDLAINAYELSSLSKNETEEIFDHSTYGVEIDDLQEAVTGEPDNSLDRTDMIAANFSTCGADFVDSDCHINADCFVVKNTTDSQLLSHIERCHYETLAADDLNVGCPSCINVKEYPLGENDDGSLVVKAHSNIPNSFIAVEQSVLNGPACQSDLSDPATHNSAVILESQNNHDSFQDRHTDCRPAGEPNNEEAAHDHSVSSTLEKDASVCGLEPVLDDHVHGIHEESTVIVEGPGGHMSRSLTLAEATDTILFCSSIIHDIAYKAAAIGMDEELLVPPEASRPMVTIVGKSVNEQNSRKMPSKHTQKSQKFKRKKLETPTKTPLTESGTNVIVHGSDPPANTENITTKPSDGIKPPKLESKCNCTVM